MSFLITKECFGLHPASLQDHPVDLLLIPASVLLLSSHADKPIDLLQEDIIGVLTVYETIHLAASLPLPLNLAPWFLTLLNFSISADTNF
jgi:hypothetical protein